jgi:hypothetical protein
MRAFTLIYREARPLVASACRVAFKDMGRTRITCEVDELAFRLCGNNGTDLT